jgi:outer membrane lipoprotein-sorting protein
MFKKILAAFIFLISSNELMAGVSQNIYSQHKSDLTQIENYVNNIKYLNANFIQESNNGGESVTGKLMLSRPGKMRVEYGKPTPLLIVVNDSVLSYTDLELEETSYLSTNATPASLLTRQNFSFSAKDVEIINFEKSADLIRVGIMKKNKKEAGLFSLIFKTNPLRFIKMEVKNDLDEVTKVSFTSLKFGDPIDDKIFIIKNKNLPE